MILIYYTESLTLIFSFVLNTKKQNEYIGRKEND